MTDTAAQVSDSVRQQHRALTQAAGFAELRGRTQIEILGRDRAQLLHGLCTNDIKSLRPGQGCEAFLTNGQGHTIGYINVFCQPESLVVESVAGVGAEIIRSLDRYVIREDVRFVDRTGEWNEFLIGGPRGTDRLRSMLQVEFPPSPLDHVAMTAGEWTGSLRRVPYTGADCFFLSVNRSAANSLAQQLTVLGVVNCQDETVEIARIEAGTPLFGRDVTDANLPQEVDRTAQAISFRKGCYLGQETIARLDSLGHVNRSLSGLVFGGAEIPPAGAEIRIDGKLVAKVTSSCWSIRLDRPLALAYVRSEHRNAGKPIPTSWGDARVVRVPIW